MFVLNSTAALRVDSISKASAQTGVTSVAGCARTKGNRSCFHSLQTADYTGASRCPSARGPVGTPLPHPGLGSPEQAPQEQATSKGVWSSWSLDLSGSNGPSITSTHRETTKAFGDLQLCRSLLPVPRARGWALWRPSGKRRMSHVLRRLLL